MTPRFVPPAVPYRVTAVQESHAVPNAMVAAPPVPMPELAPVVPVPMLYGGNSGNSLPPTPQPGEAVVQRKPLASVSDELDGFYARLAKMQLERHQLGEALALVQKIKSETFRVRTVVDLAEYVSRDKNFRNEAEQLYRLAIAGMAALDRGQPFRIDLNGNAVPPVSIPKPVAVPPVAPTPPPTPRPQPVLMDEEPFVPVPPTPDDLSRAVPGNAPGQRPTRPAPDPPRENKDNGVIITPSPPSPPSPSAKPKPDLEEIPTPFVQQEVLPPPKQPATAILLDDIDDVPVPSPPPSTPPTPKPEPPPVRPTVSLDDEEGSDTPSTIPTPPTPPTPPKPPEVKTPTTRPLSRPIILEEN